MQHPDLQVVPERWVLGESFVPKGRYVDRDFLQLELDELFPKVWQPACREEEIPDAGSFYEYTIGRESILVVRQPDGSIKAMYNACAHRGMKVIGGAGCVDELRCRFHGWRYALDGSSTFVACKDEFRDRPDEEWGLRQVHVDMWAGWVFITMVDDPEPLLEWLDPLPEALAPFRLEDTRYRWRKRTNIPANWKTVVDAFIEGYHTPGTHPQTMRYHEGLRPSASPAPVEEFVYAPYTPSTRYRNHSRFTYQARPENAERDQERMKLAARPEVYARTMQYQHLEVGSLVTERDYRAADRLALMEPSETPPIFMYLQMIEDLALEEGVDYPAMSIETYFAGNGDWHVFPTLILLVEKSCTLGYRVRPDADDPDRCIFEMFSLEHFAPGEVPDTKWQVFDHWREHDGWGQLPTQDLKNIADIQAGLHSRGFAGHWLNQDQESGIYNQHAIADRFIFGVDHDA